MALITCPECGGTVSDTAETCPHCGYQLIEETQTVTSNVTNYVNTTRNGYDVMLVDYMKGKLYTANKIAEVISCSYLEASNLLNNAPCYLYNDLSYSDALYIAQSLQYYGMRIALYDPNGSVTYYAPVGYNRVLPSLLNVVRRPIFTVMPPRNHEFVIRRQKVSLRREEPRKARPRMEMPMPSQPKRSTFGGNNAPKQNSPAPRGQSNRSMNNSRNAGPQNNRGGQPQGNRGGQPQGGRGGNRGGGKGR